MPEIRPNPRKLSVDSKHASDLEVSHDLLENQTRRCVVVGQSVYYPLPPQAR